MDILSLNLIFQKMLSKRSSELAPSRELRLPNAVRATGVTQRIVYCFLQIVVLRICKGLPLIKTFLMPGGGREVKCMYWKVSVGLKCVRTSRIRSFIFRFYIRMCPGKLFQ